MLMFQVIGVLFLFVVPTICDETNVNHLNITNDFNNDTSDRNKRTIAQFLVNIGDVFGYDVQKRPSVIPPTAAPAAPPAAAAAPAPGPAPAPAAQRKPGPAPPPPLPPRPAPPPGPPPAPPAPPAPVTAPPLLTDSIRKTFSINFNWNRSKSPGPGAPAPAPAAPAPAPAAPAPAGPAPKAPPPPPPPPPGVPAKIIPKAQLYQDYETYQNEPKYYDYNLDPNHEYSDYDYNDRHKNSEPEKTQRLHIHIPEFTEETKEKRADDHVVSKEKFKENFQNFWDKSPFTADNGYKYLTKPEPETKNFQQTLSKYEEYDITPKHHNSVRSLDNPKLQLISNYRIVHGKGNPQSYASQYVNKKLLNYYKNKFEADAANHQQPANSQNPTIIEPINYFSRYPGEIHFKSPSPHFLTIDKINKEIQRGKDNYYKLENLRDAPFTNEPEQKNNPQPEFVEPKLAPEEEETEQNVKPPKKHPDAEYIGDRKKIEQEPANENENLKATDRGENPTLAQIQDVDGSIDHEVLPLFKENDRELAKIEQNSEDDEAPPPKHEDDNDDESKENLEDDADEAEPSQEENYDDGKENQNLTQEELSDLYEKEREAYYNDKTVPQYNFDQEANKKFFENLPYYNYYGDENTLREKFRNENDEDSPQYEEDEEDERYKFTPPTYKELNFERNEEELEEKPEQEEELEENPEQEEELEENDEEKEELKEEDSNDSENENQESNSEEVEAEENEEESKPVKATNGFVPNTLPIFTTPAEETVANNFHQPLGVAPEYFGEHQGAVDSFNADFQKNFPPPTNLLVQESQTKLEKNFDKIKPLDLKQFDTDFHKTFPAPHHFLAQQTETKPAKVNPTPKQEKDNNKKTKNPHNDKKPYVTSKPRKEKEKSAADQKTQVTNNSNQIIQPLFSGVISPGLLQELHKSDKPLTIPFDVEYSASEIKSRIAAVNDGYVNHYVPESYSTDFSYTVPEPPPKDYAKLETKDYVDDDKLSQNAKIYTRESGRTSAHISFNGDSYPLV